MEPAHLVSKQAASEPRMALSGLQSNRGPEIEKNVITLSGMGFRNFPRHLFLQPDPHRPEIANQWGFRPF